MRAKFSFDEVVEFEQSSEQTVRVRQGESFDFSLVDFGGDMTLKLGTLEHDQVLSVIEDGRANDHIGARISADVRGFTEIQVQKDRQVVFWLTIEVFNGEGTALKSNTSVEQRS